MTAPAPPAPPAPPGPAAPPEPLGPGGLEGAGVVSSYDDLFASIGSGDGFQIAFATAGAALDTLGFVADPFGSLIAAGAGWLIEHVSVLKEPFDALAGDPWRITEQARSWHDASVELAAVAEAQRGFALPGPAGPGSAAGWAGEAGEAYRRAAEDRAAAMAAIAQKADQLAGVMITGGAMIGATRALVRDLIADFIATVVEWVLAGSVLSALTGGVSLAAALGWVIVDAFLLASDIARRIERLLEAVAAAGHAASGLAAGMLDAARQAARVAGDLHAGAGPIDDIIGGTHAGAVVEHGKQQSNADF